MYFDLYDDTLNTQTKLVALLTNKFLNFTSLYFFLIVSSILILFSLNVQCKQVLGAVWKKQLTLPWGKK